jgi:hypothetical protein
MIKNRLREFDKDIDHLMDILKKNELIESELERLKAYEANLFKFNEQSISFFIIGLIIDKCKLDLNFMNYREKLEKLFDIKLMNVDSIIKNKINEPTMNKLKENLDAMPSKIFPSQGKQLCKNILSENAIKLDNAAINWLKNIITSKPSSEWDQKLWLALRVKYENKYGL